MPGTLSAYIAIGQQSNSPFVGTSALTAEAIERYARTAVFGGSGALTAPGIKSQQGVSPALAGSGALSFITNQIYSSAAQFGGAGVLSGVTTPERAGLLAGAGALSAAALQQYPRAAGTSGGSVLTATVTERYAAAPGLVGAGALTASGQERYAQAAALNGSGAMMCDFKQIYEKLTGLFGGGSLTGGAKPSHDRAAALGSTGQLMATAAATIGDTPAQPPVFDSTSAANTQVNAGTDQGVTVTHNCTGTDREITTVVLVSWAAGAAAPSAVNATYAGTPMVSQGRVYLNNTTTGPSALIEIFTLMNPVTGSQTSRGGVTSTSASEISIASTSWTGVLSVASGGFSSSFGTEAGPALSQTVLSSPYRKIVQAFAHESASAIASYNQTSRQAMAVASHPVRAHMGDATGATSTVAFAGTRTDGVDYCAAAVQLVGSKPLKVDIVGSASVVDTNTMALPAHNIGDLIILGVGAASGSGPVKPAAGGTVPNWLPLETFKETTEIVYVVHAVATATNHTMGNWGTTTTVTGVFAVVLRGQHASVPIGAHASRWGENPATAVPAPAVTLTKTDGSSALLHIYGHGDIMTWSPPPAGHTLLTSKSSASNNRSCFCVNSKDDTTSDGAVAQDFTTAFSGSSEAATIEVLSAIATPSKAHFADTFNRANGDPGALWVPYGSYAFSPNFLSINGNKLVPGSADPCVSAFVESMKTNDMQVTCTVAGNFSSGEIMYIQLRAASDRQIVIHCAHGAAWSILTSTAWSGGTQRAASGSSPVLQAGNVITVKAQGTLYTVTHSVSGVVASWDDTGNLHAQDVGHRYVGVGLNLASASTTKGIDSFTADDL